MKSINETVLEVELIAIEMEKSIDTLINTINSHNGLVLENKNRPDAKLLDIELRKSECLNRVQSKIDELLRLF